VVLRAVNDYEEGMTPFGAFHAATAETRKSDVLSSENGYGNIEVSRPHRNRSMKTTSESRY
jgi:hypothetical protein